MGELFENSHDTDKKFVPVREGAKRVSYTTDYVARLAREGKVEAVREGRVWLVELNSLKLFSLAAKAEAIRKQEELKVQRKLERATAKLIKEPADRKIADPRFSQKAMLESVVVTVCIALMAILWQSAAQAELAHTDLTEGARVVGSEVQQALVLDAIASIDMPSWLWFFRLEEVTRPTELVDSTAEYDPALLDGGVYPAQLDVASNELLIVDQGQGVPVQREYIADSFSDDVIVEFVTSEEGTVEVGFTSGATESYPFRVVPVPVAYQKGTSETN